MTGKADSALSRLFSSAKSLNTVSDQISAQIKELEGALVAQGIGVSAWVEVDRWTSDDEYQLETIASIGFGKHDGKWGLLYQLWCDVFDEARVCFLRDTARDIRIGSLEKMPMLFEKLADETQKLTESATRNLADAKAITSALKSKGSK